MRKGELKALREVAEAAKNMPRRADEPSGGAMAIFFIYASTVWNLDEKLRRLEGILKHPKMNGR